MDKYYAQALKNALGNILPKVKTVNEEYTSDGSPWSMKWKGLRVGDNGISAGSYGTPDDPYYFADVYARLGDRKVMPDFEKTLHTPVGDVNLASNMEDYNSLSATYNPVHVDRYHRVTPDNEYEYNSAHLVNTNGLIPGVTKERWGNETTYGAELQGLPTEMFEHGGYKGGVNTPLGRINGGFSDDDVLWADYTPNDRARSYVQALKNLLGR